MKPGYVTLIICLALPGCASLTGSKEQHYICSDDTVSDPALQSIKDLPA